METIIGLALAATTVVKVLIDILKIGWDAPRWAAPALATLLGPAAVILLMLASAQALTEQTVAQAVLAGLLAAGGAVGVTELARREKRSVDPPLPFTLSDDFLTRPPGSGRS